MDGDIEEDGTCKNLVAIEAGSRTTDDVEEMHVELLQRDIKLSEGLEEGMLTEKGTAHKLIKEATAEEIAMARGCSFTVEFETMSGNIKASGSGNGALMQFKVGGVWGHPMWLFHSVGNPGDGATSGQKMSKQYAMSKWPEQVKIIAGGIDALGYQRIEFLVGSLRVPVVNAPSNIDLNYPGSTSSPSMKYWVDGDQTAPNSNTFDVPALVSGTFTVVFETMSGGIKSSGSGDGAFMQFKIGGRWTRPRWLFKRVGNPGNGASSGETKRTKFAMRRWPTEMKITAGGNDALGYQRIDFVLSSGIVYNIVSAPSNVDLNYPRSKSSPSMKYWVDGDQMAPKSNTFPVPSKPCPGR